MTLAQSALLKMSQYYRFQLGHPSIRVPIQKFHVSDKKQNIKMRLQRLEMVLN